MSENKNTIRNGIIITVIGGLILSFLLVLIPTFWYWLINFFRNLWLSLFLKVELSIWLFVLLLIASFCSLFRIGKFFISIQEKHQTMKPALEPKKCVDAKEQEENKEIFSKEEKYVMAFFAKSDDQELFLTEIRLGIKCNNIRTKNALDQLSNKGLIKGYYRNSYSGEKSYTLTTSGRELIVSLGWDREFQK